MKTNKVRQRLYAGEPTLGCFLGLGSPHVAELLGHAGFDWLVVETEHNGLDSAEIERMLMAINGTDAVPLVRIPAADPVFIQRALDMGAMGIVVPMIRTAAQAEAIVRATRYPPLGTRSFGPLRASRYTLDNADYFAQANDNLLVVCILETAEAVDNLKDIVAVPGVDALFLGPFDLCLSLGLDPMRQPHPEIEEIAQRALAQCRRYGIAMGMGAGTPEELQTRRTQGVTMLGYGPDYAMLVKAAVAGITAVRG